MAFNPFNLFKGNPKVIELMTKNEQLELLLMEEPFISQFKRSDNQNLQNYMNYERYRELIEYITVLKQQNASDKNKGYKFPFVAAEILAVNNETTYKYLLEEVVYAEDVVEEEVEIEKEIDSESSDRSYSSIKSNNSSKKEKHEAKNFEEEDKENFILRNENDKDLSQFNFSEDKQICEDDFPDAKLRKRVIVKQLRKRTVKKPYEPLIFSLIRYFQNSAIIHILDGYVCKVLDSIISNRFQQFIKIVDKYDRLGELKHIFSHIESYSVQQILLNFISKLIDFDQITSLSDESALIEIIQEQCAQHFEQWHQTGLNEEDRSYYLHLYAVIIQKITGKITPKLAQIEKQESSPTMFAKQLTILETIMHKSHIEQLIHILGEVILHFDEHLTYAKIVTGYLRVLKNIIRSFLLLKNILNHTKKEKIGKEQLHSAKLMVQTCEDAFDRLIRMGLTFIFEDLLMLDHADLITHKLKHSLLSKVQFLEILGILVKDNIYFSRKTAIDTPQYEHLFHLMEIYPKSSIVHNGLLQLILPFLKPENDASTVNKLFQKKKFLSEIYQIIKNDYQIRYEKKQQRRKCYIGHIMQICLAIENLSFEGSEELTQYKQSDEWQYIHECLAEEKATRNIYLGGMQRLKEKKPVIFFSKNQCLTHFKYFLAGVKFNIFDEFQNYQPGNSDSQQEKEDPKDLFLNEQTAEERNIMQAIIEDDGKYLDENIIH